MHSKVRDVYALKGIFLLIGGTMVGMERKVWVRWPEIFGIKVENL